MRVLMTGAGAPGAAGVLRCLKADGTLDVVGCDANPNAIGKYLNPAFETIPKAGDPDFIDAIFSVCKKHDIKLILPLVTRELFPLSKYKHDFEKQGIRVLVSEYENLCIANDKGELYKKLSEGGILTPDFRIVNNVTEFEQAVYELGYPDKPVCFKPCISNGMRGFRILDPTKDEFDILFNYKPSAEYIEMDKALKLLDNPKMPPLIVSEYLPGQEYTIDCVGKNGVCQVAVPRLRRKMVQGISVEGTVEKNEEIINYCTQIVNHIGLHGNIGIQVKRAADGRFKILEINPRVQGTTVALLGAGINLPLLTAKMELGEDIDFTHLPIQWGTNFSRYWMEVFY